MEDVTLPQGTTVLADGKVEYVLRYPVKYMVGNSEEQLAKIIVRRKNFADNIAIKAMTNAVDIGFTLMCRLTGLDAKIISEIDDVDQEAFGQIVESFTTPGPQTQTSVPGS